MTKINNHKKTKEILEKKYFKSKKSKTFRFFYFWIAYKQVKSFVAFAVKNII